MKTLDHAMTDEIIKLGKITKKNLNKKDFSHLKKIIFLNRLFLIIGYGTTWIFPNPVSMVSISLAAVGRWTIVAHHVLHGGYDFVPHTPFRYHSKIFAQKWRRYIDWFDWIYPPAWNYEHNILHHFYTNEATDPDQMSYSQPNLVNYPNWIKKLVFYLIISFWKPWYYARNTMKAYCEKKDYHHNMNFKPYRKQYYIKCYLPYVVFHFIIIPLLFVPISWLAVLYVLINQLGAEIISNWHSFLIIVPNHTGSDLLLQEQHFKSKEDFVKKQLLSSCNYNTGGFWRDYLHGYLNYQIEHHLFPDLPISQYVKLQPKIKKICQDYGFPYVQEPLQLRIKKLFCIMLEKEKMYRH